jgi:polyisoprenoid-binding protein YceI
MNRLKGFAAAALLLVSTSATASDWRMDPAASSLEFAATYEREPAPGRFKQFDTRLRFDPARPQDSELHVTVTLASADMGSAELNEGMREPDWFDMARFPKAEFRARGLRRDAPNRYTARGTLDLKGVKQEIAVPFTWSVTNDKAVMEGELTLKRTLFGVGSGEWATDSPIGLDVKVKFRVALRKGT